MPRLFIALDLPAHIKQQLAQLPRAMSGARWQTIEQMHLTLKFIGELDNSNMPELIEALAQIKAQPFKLRINSVDYVGSKRSPRILYAQIEKNPELSKLYKQINKVLEKTGLELKKQKLNPHITLARLKLTPYPAIAQFLQAESLLKSEYFTIDAFHLFRSKLSLTGSQYQIAESFYFAEKSQD